MSMLMSRMRFKIKLLAIYNGMDEWQEQLDDVKYLKAPELTFELT